MEIGDVPEKDLNIYRQEFQRGEKLFEKASEEYINTDEMHKKKQLEKVMQETLHAMNSIINNVLREKGTTKQKKLLDDYKNFKNDTTENTRGQITKDIEDIKKSL